MTSVVGATAKSSSGTLYIAWLVAIAATLGALFVGEVMGQAPCTLCWYQRIAMFPLAVLLGIASYRGDYASWRYTLPIAALGWLIAGFHLLLYYGLIPEGIEPCGAGPSCSDASMLLFDVPLPLMSLAAFSLIIVALVPLVRSTK